jgi:hypothetical protein
MAILVAVMAIALMSALGVALVLATSTETLIASNFRNSSEGLYAAEAVVERAIDDLLAFPDWNLLLGGGLQSSFVDGPPNGTRTLGDGSTIDLAQVVNKANCAKTTCTAADLVAVMPNRPWGANNPQWTLFAYGAVSRLLPANAIDSAYYIVALVADDPSENDANPLRDGTTPCAAGQNGLDGSCNPGSGVIALRGEAFGPRGAHRVAEMTVVRSDAAQPGPTRIRVLSWREIR